MTGEVVSLGDTAVRAWWSDRRHGDMSKLGSPMVAPPPAPPGTTLFRLTQVHGGKVVRVQATGTIAGDSPPTDERPSEGDALVTNWDRAVLAVLAADCGALALGSPEGIHGAVHVGWRGLMSEVVQNAVQAMRHWGASDVEAALGPCIGPCCYTFSPDDLEPIGLRYGHAVASKTNAGDTALDLPAAIDAALMESGVTRRPAPPPCTSCQPGYFSHRRDGSPQRQVLTVWREPTS